MLKRDKNCADCAFCRYPRKEVFAYRGYPQGLFIPKEANAHHSVYFLLKGELWINSLEYPDTVIREGTFILLPADSMVEYRIHTPSEAIVYTFDHLPNVCDTRFRSGFQYIEETAAPLPVMQSCDPIRGFLEEIKTSLINHLSCAGYMQSKQNELFYLLNFYYTQKELGVFYAPVHIRNQSFRYFVLNNYHRVKDVTGFAGLGNYKPHIFRKLFSETFNEPVYQWILKQKCRDIYRDITTTKMSITEISQKYGFESLPNFSHFCRSHFGKPPRALRAQPHTAE
ncbi:MAG: helix-turn-helix transcriptional regulator [Tannerellaceae bacterium]|jgi:AraC-like DNA-binding protein|nr:helix-turn-helix transcriptional regulator [Tannerellaceae bacterium]